VQKQFISELSQDYNVFTFRIFIVIVLGGITIYYLLQDKKTTDQSTIKEKETEEEVEPPKPRDFTVEQLREFNGKINKSIYISLKGEVYDVTAAVDFYGDGSSYHCFAGREATRAMAKLSFDEEDLSSLNLEDLSPFDKNSLDDWINKFKYYRQYPVAGKCTVPPTPKEFTVEELSEYKGKQDVPSNRVNAPIYIGINGKVIDVSYGGFEMYGEGGPYHIFAGIDASKALAKMSFLEEDLKSTDLSDLTGEQIKILNDWEKKFIEVKKYPVVGTFVK
jgi:membrane-associated progesterone receptor component